MKINTFKVINEAIDDIDSLKDKMAKRSEGRKLYDIKDMNSVLDMAFKANKRQQRASDPATGKYQPINVLIVGAAGSGKSESIEAWARRNHLNFYMTTGSELDTETIKGIPKVVEKRRAKEKIDPKADLSSEERSEIDYRYMNLPSTVFDNLDIPNVRSVLFLDELNRSYEECRAALLSIIQSHTVPDSQLPTNKRRLKNFIFTIAAVNPVDEAHKGTDLLDLAMLTRFFIFDWKPKVEITRAWFLEELEREAKQLVKYYKEVQKNGGKDEFGDPYDEDDFNEDMDATLNMIEMVKAVFTKDLTYDEGETLTQAQEKQKAVINPRTLTSAIQMSNGDKAAFLDILPGMCGVEPKSDTMKKFKLALSGVAEKSADSREMRYKKTIRTNMDKADEWEASH